MNTIHYSQSWEDPQTLTDALNINPADNVLSIASAGDNTFALLLKNPESITAIDVNPAQIDLMELKIRAIQYLNYEDFISFLGYRKCNDRKKLYSYIRRDLSERARDYWDTQPRKISKGIAHCGKFESYFKIFRNFVLPFIHSRENIQQLLSSQCFEQQEVFYHGAWNHIWWRVLFRIFFCKFILGHIGRDPSFFNYVSLEKIALELFERSRKGITEVPVKNNFFLEYILTGKIMSLRNAHPYLLAENFEYLKENVGNIQLVTANLIDYLRTLDHSSISKYNLSDVFEYMSRSEFEITLNELIRCGTNNSSLVFWTLFVPRIVPYKLSKKLNSSHLLAHKLRKNDRGFFYGSFNVWRTIAKQEKHSYPPLEKIEEL